MTVNENKLKVVNILSNSSEVSRSCILALSGVDVSLPHYNVILPKYTKLSDDCSSSEDKQINPNQIRTVDNVIVLSHDAYLSTSDGIESDVGHVDHISYKGQI